MRGPLEGYMRVGIVHFMAFPETMGGEGPVLETVRRIAEDAFFDAIEVTRIKDEGVREEVRRCIDSSGLGVSFGAQPMLLSGGHDLNAQDPHVREAAMAVIREAIDQASELGAGSVALLSGVDPGEAERGSAMGLLIDSLKKLSAYGEEQGGVSITLETFDRDVDKKCLIGPAREALQVAEEIRASYPGFGLMYDLSHAPLLGERASDALPLLKDHLVHIHIGNCAMRDNAHPAYGDMHPRFGIDGGENGVQELADFLKVLLDIGYLSEKSPGGVGFEVKPMAGESSELIIANAKRTLKSAWALV